MIGNWTLENNLLRGLPESHAPSPASPGGLSPDRHTQHLTPASQLSRDINMSTDALTAQRHMAQYYSLIFISNFCFCVIIHLKTVILPRNKDKEFSASSVQRFLRQMKIDASRSQLEISLKDKKHLVWVCILIVTCFKSQIILKQFWSTND